MESANTASRELEKLGLLSHAVRVAESAKQSFAYSQKQFNHYWPIYYKKTVETATPVLVATKERAEWLWLQSLPYRKTMQTYLQQALDYINVN